MECRIGLVDLSVTVVVPTVSDDLGVAGIDLRIGIVTVAFADHPLVSIRIRFIIRYRPVTIGIDAVAQFLDARIELRIRVVTIGPATCLVAESVFIHIPAYPSTGRETSVAPHVVTFGPQGRRKAFVVA